MKILLIDDNEDFAITLSEGITPTGHQFLFSTDGRQGLRMIREENFDVILLDVGMPYFSGLDIINELIKDGTINSYNIVVLTGTAMKDLELAQLVKKGVKGYMRKPVSIEDLMSELDRFNIEPVFH
ncbi:MAG: response regulator [Thaumarchaeota archaeon]|nr:response regulator [Nitrososphaerota archaeon]